MMPTPDPYPRLSKTKLQFYSGLDSVKTRRKKGLFAAEGAKCVLDMLRGFEPEAILIDFSRIDEIPGWVCGLPESVHDKIRTVSASEMKSLSSFVTIPGMLGIFCLPQPDETIPLLESGRLYLALDGVRDPGNFGSIVRTADWYGIHTIFASRESADIFNPKCLQAAMGSAADVKVIYTDLAELIDSNPGMPIYGTLLDGENIYTATLEPHGLIVMGNEGKGLTEDIRRRLNRRLFIPPYDAIHGESLNVGAATASVLAIFRSCDFNNHKN